MRLCLIFNETVCQLLQFWYISASNLGLILVNGIPIVRTDISVTNGVIHAINRLLLPPELYTRRKPATMAPPPRNDPIPGKQCAFLGFLELLFIWLNYEIVENVHWNFININHNFFGNDDKQINFSVFNSNRKCL